MQTLRRYEKIWGDSLQIHEGSGWCEMKMSNVVSKCDIADFPIKEVFTKENMKDICAKRLLDSYRRIILPTRPVKCINAIVFFRKLIKNRLNIIFCGPIECKKGFLNRYISNFDKKYIFTKEDWACIVCIPGNGKKTNAYIFNKNGLEPKNELDGGIPWNDEKCSPIEAFGDQMQMTFGIPKGMEDDPLTWKKSTLNIDEKHYLILQTICIAMM